MADKIKIRRGLISELPNLDEAEFGLATDTGTLYIGTEEATNILINPVLAFQDGYSIDGYLVPAVDNVHNLGTPDNRWHSVYVGPGSLNIVAKDTDTGHAVNKEFRISVDADTGTLQFIDENNIVLMILDSDVGASFPQGGGKDEGLATTVEEHKIQNSDAFQTILKDLDGYQTQINALSPDVTFQEFKSQQYQVNQSVLQSLDGYATVLNTAATGDGYIAFYTSTGTNLAGDNDLFWDRANNEFSVGKSSSTEALFRADLTNNRVVVGNNIGQFDTLTVHGTGIRIATFGNAAQGELKFSQHATPPTITGNESFGFAFNTVSANSALVIDDLGRVGLNAGAAPIVARLAAFGTGIGFPATSGTTQSAGHVVRLKDSSNAVLDIGGNASSGLWLQATDQADLSLEYPLLLNPNGGFVGIGNTNPSFALDVAGDINIAGAIYNDDLSETIQVIRQAADGYASVPNTASIGDGYVAFFIDGGRQLAGDNDLFWDRENNRLGLGISPLRKLDIKQSEDTVNDGLGISNTIGNSRLNLFKVDATGYIYSGSSGESPLVLNGIGNVGIGIDTPSALLHVAGDGYYDGYLMPFTDNVHWLGTPDKRWQSLYLGPSSLHISSTLAESGVARNYSLAISQAPGSSLGNLIIGHDEVGVVAITPDGKVQVGDTAFKLDFDLGGAGVPGIQFDTNDALRYDRANDVMQFLVGNTVRFNVFTTGAQVFGNAGVDVLAEDTGALFTSRNDSALGDPTQLVIGHNFGVTHIKNMRGPLDIFANGVHEFTTNTGGVQIPNGLVVGFLAQPDIDEVQVGDADFKLDFNLGGASVPGLQFSAGDFITYNRTTNKLSFQSGSVERLSIDEFGAVIIGAPSAATFPTGTNLIVVSTTTPIAAFEAVINSSTGNVFQFQKARGTISVPTTVLDEDSLAGIDFAGYDGTAYRTAARISGFADVAPSGGVLPGRLTFSTAPPGGIVVERLRINSDGYIQTLGVSPIEAATQIRVSGTNAFTSGIEFYTNTVDRRGFVGWRGTSSGSNLNAAGMYLVNFDNSGLWLGTDSLTRMFIDSSGQTHISASTTTQTIGGVPSKLFVRRETGQWGISIEAATGNQADLIFRDPDNSTDNKIVQFVLGSNSDRFQIRSLTDAGTVKSNLLDAYLESSIISLPSRGETLYWGGGTNIYPLPPNDSIGNLVGRASAADFRIALQDGGGRVNMYWNAYRDTGGTYTYQAAAESAARINMTDSTTGGEIGFYTAPDSVNAGDAITWTSQLIIEHSSFTMPGFTAYISVTNLTDTTASTDVVNPFKDAYHAAYVEDTNWRHNVASNNITFTPTDGRFTVNRDGVYAIEVICILTQSSTGNLDTLAIRLNGATDIWVAQPFVHSSVDPVERSITFYYSLVATNYVELLVDGSAALTIIADNGTTFNMTRIA